MSSFFQSQVFCKVRLFSTKSGFLQSRVLYKVKSFSVKFYKKSPYVILFPKEIYEAGSVKTFDRGKQCLHKRSKRRIKI